MKKYLLDTNICVYFLKGLYSLDKKIEKAETENCFVSEITIAELKFGVENSEHQEKNRKTVDEFVNKFNTIVAELTSGEYYKIKCYYKKYQEIDLNLFTFILQFKNENDEMVTTIATDEQGIVFTKIADKIDSNGQI